MVLKLSINDVVVIQKVSNGDGKPHFFGWNYYFTRSLCSKIQMSLFSAEKCSEERVFGLTGFILHCTKRA